MSKQNLISAELSPVDQADIIKKLAGVKEKLDFLIFLQRGCRRTLQPDQIQDWSK